jgi:hypothetical protein
VLVQATAEDREDVADLAGERAAGEERLEGGIGADGDDAERG